MTHEGPFIARTQWADHEPEFVPMHLPTAEAWEHHIGSPGGPNECKTTSELYAWLRSWEHQQMTRGDGLIAAAYHRLIVNGGPFDGTRVELRPWGMQGGATLGHNSISHAICVSGNFDVDVLTPAARDGACVEWAYAMRQGFVDVRALIDSHSRASGNSTGCCGVHQIAALPEIRTEVSGLLHISPPPPPIPPGPTPHPAVPPTIKDGSHGDLVKVWQTLLNDNTGAMLLVDGDFGILTHTKTVNFQAVMRLTRDGIVGPQTWAAMLLLASKPH